MEEEKKEAPKQTTEAEPEVTAEDPITKLEAEVADFKDKYLRALAEIENTRKRLQREKLESQSFAIQNVILDLLQPLDHFEVALKHAESASAEIKHWALGFEMILAQMKQVLQDYGVEPFDAKGESFDPHKHEAIETEERSDIAPGIVVEEFMRGYKMANRVIRPARVKVSVQKTDQTNNTKD